MTRFKILFLIIAIVQVLATSLYSQPRDAGRMVLPRGYENYDSARVGLFSIDDLYLQLQDSALTNRLADSLFCTAEYTYTGLLSTQTDLKGKRKLVMIGDSLSEDTRLFKQSYFYALPFANPPGNIVQSAPYWAEPNTTTSFNFFWKYNAVNFDPLHARYYNNTYDANDISPYAEFDAQHDSVTASYHTSRWLNGTNTIVDSVLTYGNEGRPILAGNVCRRADQLLRVEPNGVCPPQKAAYWWTGNSSDPTNKSIVSQIVDTASYSSLSAYKAWVSANAGYTPPDSMVFEAPGPVADTAKMFSTTLDFNIDTTSIDTTNANGRTVDQLPLLRLQVLYKMGDTLNAHLLPVDGWPLQPFTPFRDAVHANAVGAGWYKVIDTMITLAAYRKLDQCWKLEDTKQDGSYSHSWIFKQLHVLFQDVPHPLRNLMVPNTSDARSQWNNWAFNPDATVISQSLWPDSITVAPYDSIFPALNPNLLEIRVLSTYRAKVRVRGLALEDTDVDKFLYRKRISGDSTHSLNPLPDPISGASVLGGYDAAIAAQCSRVKAAGGPEEYFEIDVNTALQGSLWYLSFPVFGYMDYMAGKYGMAPHIHEQGGTEAIMDFRRNRIAFDGEPPSMYEDIAFGVGGTILFPRDYVANTTPTSVQYDSMLVPMAVVDSGGRGAFVYAHLPGPCYKDLGMNDPLYGLCVTRNVAVGGDTLASYKEYTNEIRGMSGHGIRNTTLPALNHPNNRRMPIEASYMFGWMDLRWEWRPDTGTEYVYYHGSQVATRPYPATPVTDTGYMLTTQRAHFPLDTLFIGSGGPPGSSNGIIHDSITIGDTTYSRYYAAIIWHDSDTCGYGTRPPTPEEFQGQVFVALANGCSSFAHQQPLGAPSPNQSGNPYGTVASKDPWHGYSNSPGLIGLGKKVLTDSFYRTGYPYNHFQNFGHEGAPGSPSEWSLHWSNDPTGNLPNYYFGYSNNWRMWRRTMGRVNQIYDSTDGRIVPHPLRYMKWLNAYSNNRCDTPSKHFENNYAPGWDAFYRYPMDNSDSITKAASFLKVTQTLPVNPWTRNSDSSYKDLSLPDNDTASYVEVGIFLDSISSSQKNYGALVVNTRTYPGRDTVDSAYYNAGLTNPNDRFRSLLGDIDVRKVFLKPDFSKCDPIFGNWTYYKVRDLWHPDSTWLLHRDSTFSIYLKPGDAKFLYFEPDIAVNVAAKTGTDIGQTRSSEFGFNNGRRITEIEHGTRDVAVYTRMNKLYVSYPAAGTTFAGSPDQSTGDNIITGYEVPIDTTDTCWRPSIAPASNDTGVAIVWWYPYTDPRLGTINHIAAAYQSKPGAAWQISVLPPPPMPFLDTTIDHHWVTPVITPINDTSWLIAAGQHLLGVPGFISGFIFVTPHSGIPYWLAGPALALDTVVNGVICHALFPSLASRPVADTFWPVRLVYQRPTVQNHHEIYYTRFKHLTDFSPMQDLVFNVSSGLCACDNVHPCIAMEADNEVARWILGWGFPGNATFYHDNVTWETKANLATLNTGLNYWPVIRTRHEAISPWHLPGLWGGYNVERLDVGANYYHYPVVSSENRLWDGKFWYGHGAKDLHEFIRLAFQDKQMIVADAWAPNWMWTLIPPPYGTWPSLAQSSLPVSNMTDSGMVPRSFALLKNASYNGTQYAMVTNGWLNGIQWLVMPDIFMMLYGPQPDTEECRGIIGDIALQKGRTIPSNPSNTPQLVPFAAMDIMQYGMDNDWPSPPREINEVHTANFAIHSCDSIIIPRAVGATNFTAIQNDLTSRDTVTFRLTVRRAADTSYIGTMDSMSITKTTIYWPGYTTGFASDTARYQVPCGWPDDSAFVMAELLRSDTLDSLNRSYIEVMDTTDTGSALAMKRSTTPAAVPGVTSDIEMTVHPNPAGNYTRICVADLPADIPANVEVVNEEGTTVATLYNATPDAELGLCLTWDCSQVPSGIYYAHIANSIMGRAVKISVQH